MKTTMKLAGAAAAACAACCTFAIIPTALVGTGLAAIAAAACTWGIGLLALAVPVGGLYFLSRHKAAPVEMSKAPMASVGCGHRSSRSSPDDDARPIACTPGGTDCKEGVAEIGALAGRSLHHAERGSYHLGAAGNDGLPIYDRFAPELAASALKETA